MAVRSTIDADTSVTAGPPVYEAPGGPEALIAVGEVLVKFRDPAAHERVFAQHLGLFIVCAL